MYITVSVTTFDVIQITKLFPPLKPSQTAYLIQKYIKMVKDIKVYKDNNFYRTYFSPLTRTHQNYDRFISFSFISLKVRKTRL